MTAENPAARRGSGRSGNTEGDLVAATRRGDGAAFDELVARNSRQAMQVALRLLRHREDAEDLVQEAFLTALEKIDTFDSGRHFTPWLIRIVFNRGLNVLKSRARRQAAPLPESVPARDCSPLEAAELTELRMHLGHALAALPERRRWIVELFEIDGFSGPEIAEILEIPEGTVRWELHEARRALRAPLAAFARRVP